MKARLFIQKNSVFFAISFTVFLIAMSSFLTFYGRYQVREFNHSKEQAERAQAGIDNVFLWMNEMDKGVRGFLISPQEEFLLPYKNGGEYAANFDTLQHILEMQNYTNTDKFVKAKVSMDDYYKFLGDIIALVKAGNKEEALRLYQEDRGQGVWHINNQFAMDARDFERTLHEEVKRRYQRLLDIAALMQVLLLAIGVPTLLFVIHQIRKSELFRRKLFSDLSDSRNTYLFNDLQKHDQRQEKNFINQLIVDLEKAAGFVQKISTGDYSATWGGINDKNREANKDNLAGALIHMREQMKSVKEEGEQRLWTTEGVSMVAEITRKHQEEPQTLADELLSYLVKYISANQGALFFSQEDEVGNHVLALAACYAYDKKKHAEEEVKPGQGLVGQSFMEKKTIHLTRVPDQYVNITSGLGEATPSVLLLVPLIFNDRVMGVLEVASFDAIKPYRIAFLESVGEIVASAVATVRMNVKTKQLLSQSQESTEALRAQEEEMRQNMEELQATQEEMERKAHEYEAVIEEQQKRIGVLEKNT